MNKKFGILMSIAGLILFGVSLFADQLALGDADPDHFVVGSKQITGMIVGGLVFFFGLFIWGKKEFHKIRSK